MFRRASIPLPLAGFGLDLIEAEARRSGMTLAHFVEQAAVYYAAAPDTGRPSRRVPRFVREAERRVGSATVDVELSPDTWRALEELAEEQGTSVELMVLHAAMLYAAESASPQQR
jgi:uncharacterized protein (DUF1778 family)